MVQYIKHILVMPYVMHEWHIYINELWIHQPTMQKWLIGLLDIRLHNGSCIYMLDENQ